MANDKSSKSDQIRALREKAYADRLKAPNYDGFREKIVRQQEELQKLADDVKAKPKRGRPKTGFDKAAWQREYMRKRRAEQKK